MLSCWLINIKVLISGKCSLWEASPELVLIKEKINK